MKEQSDDYEKFLEEAYSKIKKVETTERFEVPEAESSIQGNKTIFFNFYQICSILRRSPEHLSKFLSKELATQIILEKERAIFNRKLTKEQINNKIVAYVKEFVICPECKKPDTELVREKGFMFLHCLACGAKHSVRAKIV
ncbi:MAG: translation initiation factor IF-2 subunit beta [Candidatus Pacearchaeota archaeon]|nr:translation initiation factor IF-2 subunit beta [Candidatus Pacearchaeota archaeon]